MPTTQYNWNEPGYHDSLYKDWVRFPLYREYRAQKRKLPNQKYRFYAQTDRSTTTRNENSKLVDGYNLAPIATPIDFLNQGFVHAPDIVTNSNEVWGNATNESKGVYKISSRDEIKQWVQNALLTKMTNNPVDLGVALGEYRETANFLASAMVKTVHATRAIRKGNISEAVQVITGRVPKGQRARITKDRADYGRMKLGKSYQADDPRFNKMCDVVLGDTSRWSAVPLSAAGTVLMTNYALKPLLSDVAGVMEAYDKAYKGEHKMSFTKGYPGMGAKWLERKIDLYRNVTWSPGNSMTRRVTGTWRVGARARIDLTIQNEVIRTLDSLGLLNPISTGYELIPFSFVFDWFTGLGDYLQQINPPQGYNFSDGYYVIKTQSEISSTIDQVVKDVGYGGNYFLTHGSMQKSVERDKLGGFPPWTLQVPDIRTYKRRITNGVSLLVTLLYSEPVVDRNPTRADWTTLNKLGMSRRNFRRLAKDYR